MAPKTFTLDNVTYDDVLFILQKRNFGVDGPSLEFKSLEDQLKLVDKLLMTKRVNEYLDNTITNLCPSKFAKFNDKMTLYFESLMKQAENDVDQKHRVNIRKGKTDKTLGFDFFKENEQIVIDKLKEEFSIVIRRVPDGNVSRDLETIFDEDVPIIETEITPNKQAKKRRLADSPLTLDGCVIDKEGPINSSTGGEWDAIDTLKRLQDAILVVRTNTSDDITLKRQFTRAKQAEVHKACCDLTDLASMFILRLQVIETELAKKSKEKEIEPEKTLEVGNRPKTYASVVGSSKSNTKDTLTYAPLEPMIDKVRQPKYRTLILGKGENKDNPGYIYEAIKDDLEIGRVGGAFKAVWQTPKGVIIESESQEQQNRLEKEIGKIGDIEHVPFRKKDPSFIITGVACQFKSESDLYDSFYENNKEINDLIDRDSERTNYIEITGIRKCKNPLKNNIFIKVSPGVAEILRRDGRVIIEWLRYKVVELSSVKRCFKCHSLGHIVKDCKAESDRCARCGGPHKPNVCKGKLDCVNCKKDQVFIGHRSHPANDPKCPVYLARCELMRMRTRTDTD